MGFLSKRFEHLILQSICGEEGWKDGFALVRSFEIPVYFKNNKNFLLKNIRFLICLPIPIITSGKDQTQGKEGIPDGVIYLEG